jgi:nitroreductase
MMPEKEINFSNRNGSGNLEPNNLLDLMRRRRTVRKYRPTPIAEDSFNRIIEAATLPPSSADTLPYSFIIVKDEATKNIIRDEAESIEKRFHPKVENELKKLIEIKNITAEKPFLTQAPVLVIVAGDTRMPYWLESTWIAVSYLLLAIENEGLASLTYTPSDIHFLRKILDIPEHMSPQVIIPIGHADEEIPPKETRSEGKVHYERYGI